MKKIIKNVVLIVVMLLCVVGIAFTINCAKNNLESKEIPKMDASMPDDVFRKDDPNQDVGIGNPPDMEEGVKPEEGQMPSMPDNEHMERREFNSVSLASKYIVIICILSLVFSLCFVYLVMSIGNNAFYKNKDKLIILILLSIILSSVFTYGVVFLTNKYVLKDIEESDSEKTSVKLDKDNIVSANKINLSNETSDVTINKSGTYTFSGEFNHSIIIDTEGEVEIILDGVNIENKNTATIIGLNANKIIINLASDSENILSDGGNSEYDACIYSNVLLEFKGSGKLTLSGNQEEGEGIATENADMIFNGGVYVITSNDDGINAGGDGGTITFNDGVFYINASGDGIDSNKDAVINGGQIFVMGSDIGGDAGIDTDMGYTINGGLVVALGSDMIETPLNNSNQNTLAFTLDEKINADTLVTLMKDEDVIVSFKGSKSFKTLIISSDILTNGNYKLYTGGFNTGNLEYGIYNESKYTVGDEVRVNNSNVFSLENKISLFVSSNRR